MPFLCLGFMLTMANSHVYQAVQAYDTKTGSVWFRREAQKQDMSLQ